MIAAGLLALGLLGGAPAPHPSVVVIVLDDVGIDQLACYDPENAYATPYAYAHTPNLDALAARGARFTQFRVAPMCSPTRAMALTGRYPFRTGAGAMATPINASPTFLELGNPLPELLLPAVLPGRRGAVGKWHLGLLADEGGTMPAHPENLGFSSWRGVARNLGSDNAPPHDGEPGYYDFRWWERGLELRVVGRHATVFTRQQASRWLRLEPAEPFFLYLAFNACHAPLTLADVPPPGEHGFGSGWLQERWTNGIFRANLECADRQIGLLLERLPPGTTVFVLGDNGTLKPILEPAPGEARYPIGHPRHRPGDESTQLSLAPYSPARAKGTVFDTGIRVPLIVAGPGVVPGARSDLVDAVDLFATIAAIRGAAVPPGAAGDSVNFLRVLRGLPGERSFSFSERFAPNGVGQPRVREDRAYVRPEGPHLWKLVRRRNQPDELYDVAADPLETLDLGTGHPAYQPTLDAMLALLAS